MLIRFDEGLKVIRSFYLYAQITPQAKQSTRFVSGKDGKSHAFTDAKKVAYMKNLDKQLTKQWKAVSWHQLKGNMRVTIIYAFPWVKTSPISLGWTLYAQQPDCDNLQKPVLDSLQGLVFGNDSLIVELRSRKIRSANIGIYIKVDEVLPNRAIDFTPKTVIIPPQEISENPQKSVETPLTSGSTE